MKIPEIVLAQINAQRAAVWVRLAHVRAELDRTKVTTARSSSLRREREQLEEQSTAWLRLSDLAREENLSP